MSTDGVSRLSDFFDDVEETDLSLLTINRTRPAEVQRLVNNAFGTQSVDLDERSLPDEDDDVLVLLRDGSVSAASPLEEVMESFLLVNSDQFRTGTRGFGDELPDVLAGMDDYLFDLRGYPQSNKEKLLLVLISRHIEHLAHDAGTGVHRATFQKLSRLRDELGTREVYERLADEDLSVHVYGIPDEVPESLDVQVHRGTGPEYRHSWCVTFRPPEGMDRTGASLVAVETDVNRWRGFWTYDPERVRRIDEYLARSL